MSILAEHYSAPETTDPASAVAKPKMKVKVNVNVQKTGEDKTPSIIRRQSDEFDTVAPTRHLDNLQIIKHNS